MTYAEQERLRKEKAAKATAKVEALKELGWGEVRSFNGRYSILLPKDPAEYEVFDKGLDELPRRVYLLTRQYWGWNDGGYSDCVEYRQDPVTRGGKHGEVDTVGTLTWVGYSHYYSKDGQELACQSVAGAINNYQTEKQLADNRSDAARRAWPELEEAG